MRLLKMSLVCIGLLVGKDEALGDPLTFYFDGNVNFVHDFLELDESVFIGAQFSGSYTFDPTDIHDLFPSDPEVGQYVFGTAGQMEARIGDYDFVSDDLWMLIWNDRLSSDLYEAISTSPFSAGGYQWSAMSMVLLDETGTALDSDALPTKVPDLADYPSFAGLNLHLPGNDVGIRGTLTSLTPEPGSLALLALGATAVLAWRQR